MIFELAVLREAASVRLRAQTVLEGEMEFGKMAEKACSRTCDPLGVSGLRGDGEIWGE
jgi:hypothetical protein